MIGAKSVNKATKRVTLRLSEFPLEALASEAHRLTDEARSSAQVRAALVQAIRLYLHDTKLGGARWARPPFAKKREKEGVELDLVVDEGLLSALEEQAGRQGLSVSQVAEQAALYYAAELDAGRVTQRILDDLERSGA